MNDSCLTSCYLVQYKYQHPLDWATQQFKGFRACFVLYVINLSMRNPQKIHIMHANIIYISTIYCITYYILYNMIYIMYVIYVCVHVKSRPTVTPQTIQPVRFLCPWNLPGKTTGVGCHFLRQGIFMTWRLNLHLVHLLCWQADSLLLCHLGSPIYKFYIYIFFSIHIIIKYTRHWYVSGT